MVEVVLIDDDPVLRRAAAAALAARGHHVRAFPDAGEGLASLHAEPPEALVLELRPGAGPARFDLARRVAADFPDLPVIVVTRADEGLDAGERAAQDVDGWLPVRRYLQKPVDVEVLADEVEHVVDHGHPAAGRFGRAPWMRRFVR